jgi:hypothetical protein
VESETIRNRFPILSRFIEAKAVANVVSIMLDDSSHVTQAWVDHDGDIVLEVTLLSG